MFNERTRWNRTRRQVNGTCVNGERRSRGTGQKGMKSTRIQNAKQRERERGGREGDGNSVEGKKRKNLSRIALNRKKRNRLKLEGVNSCEYFYYFVGRGMVERRKSYFQGDKIRNYPFPFLPLSLTTFFQYRRYKCSTIATRTNKRLSVNDQRSLKIESNKKIFPIKGTGEYVPKEMVSRKLKHGHKKKASLKRVHR